MKLVIIEGIGKKDTIEKYLGKGYKVFATKGHIRDLPAKSLAVNVKKNFEPKYDIMEDKVDIAQKLKQEAKNAEAVLLATDPDREGEAISWHVANILGIDPSDQVRIVFNEISKKAITTALASPRAINMSLVDAQQARRVLDRLVGYKLSPVLCKKIQNKLSAGRVQSVTLRLVVDREREIRNFKPEEYWPFFSMLFKTGSESSIIKAVLEKKDGKKFKLTSKQDVDDAIANIDGKPYNVTNVKKSITKSKAPAPFITSTMQQDAMNKLGFSLKQTTMTAQALYEGVDCGPDGKVALVTYIRTDSTRVSKDAMDEAREFIKNKFGNDYIPEKPNFFASKKSAQDAHEAIRPISVDRTPESLKPYLNKQHYKLYKLIYERFLASQMSEAKYNSLSVEIEAGDYGFRVKGKTPLFAGYTALYSIHQEEKEESEESQGKLPDIEQGDVLNFKEYKYEQKFTKPPARYTEASLVKAMEEKGIGRPATYTPTITILANRSYTEKEGKTIKPTELGEKVVDMLVKYFVDIMDVKFTADMEAELDKIEDGGMVWQSVVGAFYEGFEDKIKLANGDTFTLKPQAVKTDIMCDKCGSPMLIRSGRFGEFLGCSGFPKCRSIMQMAKRSDEEKAQTVVNDDGSMSLSPNSVKIEVQGSTGITCDKCGKEMVIKSGKSGEFYACPGYPDCKNTKSIEKADESSEVLAPCPTCSKPLKKITTKRSTFYGCSSYPNCSFTSSAPVVEGSCPECNSYLVQKNYANGIFNACGSKGCKYKVKVADKPTEDAKE